MKVVLAVFFCCALLIGQTQKKVTIQKSGESDLLLIKTQKGFSTLIQFSESDEIEEVTCGDKESWVIEGRGRYLHVKPAKEGIVTNLNVLLKGDVVYSFLLKEISSKAGNSKEKPDLKVVVGGGDELSKLRKDKENLEEALARSERTVADRTAKGEADKKEAQKKKRRGGSSRKEGGATSKD
jgi:type IV secretory pathway VirB9-like protein